MANVVDRLGGASSSLAFKAPCRLATTTNLTSLSGFQTLDGVLPTSSEHVDLRRILVKNQTDASANGIYTMDTGTWERTKDFDGVNDFRQGTRVFVWGGSTQSGTYVVTSSMDPATFDFDTDDITFAAVGTFDQETASLGISSGGKVSFDSDDVTITHAANTLVLEGASSGYLFDAALKPSTSDGAALGSTANQWSDLFLASGAVINFDGGDVAVTHSSSQLTFSGAAVGYYFDATVAPSVNDAGPLGTPSLSWSDLCLASGGVINFDNSDVLITHSSSALAFSGAGAGYSFDAAVTASSGLSVASSFTSSGNINAVSGTTITLGGVAGKAIMLFGSTTFGIYAGSSAPAIAAGLGSLYLRTDGGSSLTRIYVNNAGSTTWVGVLTTA